MAGSAPEPVSRPFAPPGDDRTLDDDRALPRYGGGQSGTTHLGKSSVHKPVDISRPRRG